VKILENSILLTAVQFVNLALPLLWLPYLAITLGAEQFGRMTLALSICQIILTISDYGFNLSIPKAIAINRDDPKKIAIIFGSVTFIRIIFALIGIVVILVASRFIEIIYFNLLLIFTSFGMVVGNVINPQCFFQGLERLRVISFIQILAKMITLVCIFILVKEPEDIYWAAFLQAGSLLLAGIISVPFTLKVLNGSKIIWPQLAMLKAQLIDSWYFFLTSAAVNIYTTSNTIILGLIVEYKYIGYYYCAEKIIRAALMVFSPITSAVYPHVSRMVSANELSTYWKFIKKITILLSLIAIILSIGIFLLAPYLIISLFGIGYSESIQVLQVFALLPLPLAASSILGQMIMLPFGMQKQASQILIATVLVNLVIFIPATFHYGAIGAAGANVLVETFVTLSFMLFCYSRSQNY
jgi:PST family polysaccharide transporter